MKDSTFQQFQYWSLFSGQAIDKETLSDCRADQTDACWTDPQLNWCPVRSLCPFQTVNDTFLSHDTVKHCFDFVSLTDRFTSVKLATSHSPQWWFWTTDKSIFIFLILSHYVSSLIWYLLFVLGCKRTTPFFKYVDLWSNNGNKADRC